mmetsp:Transcript_12055/g.36583  ORF Transcript_12055/g.36583 Transcript_12055/m.36583 type:complete len:485 (-) Transcript_12055:65-1519(-)
MPPVSRLVVLAFLCGAFLVPIIEQAQAQQLNGLSLTVGDNLLNGLIEEAVPVVLPHLQNLPLPSFGGTEHAGVTKVHWNLTNVVLSSVNLTSLTTQFEGAGFEVAAHGVSMVVNADWEAKFRTVWDNHIHGSAVVTFYDSSADVDVDFAQSAGHLQFALRSTNVDLEHFKLKLHGGESWFANFFKVFIVAAIKDHVKSGFNEAMSDLLNEVNTISMHLPLSIPVDFDDLALNISLTAVPSVPATGYSSFPVQGNVFSLHDANNSWPPFVPSSPLPNLVSSDSVQFYIQSYVMNSAAWTLFELGQLVAHVPDLNTVDVAPFIPKLSERYPDRPLAIGIHVSTAPIFTLSSSNGATMVANASLPFEVTLKNNTIVSPCVLAATLTFGIDLDVKSVNQTAVLFGNITAFQTVFSEQSSSIGPIDVAGLEDSLNKLLSSVLIPLLDSFLNHGLAIPTLPFGIQLVNPQLQIADDYLLIGSSFALSPLS